MSIEHNAVYCKIRLHIEHNIQFKMALTVLACSLLIVHGVEQQLCCAISASVHRPLSNTFHLFREDQISESKLLLSVQYSALHFYTVAV